MLFAAGVWALETEERSHLQNGRREYAASSVDMFHFEVGTRLGPEWILYDMDLAFARLVVHRVRGVRAVLERIEVRYPENPRVRDDALAERCARVLEWDVQIPERSVSLKIEKGSGSPLRVLALVPKA